MLWLSSFFSTFFSTFSLIISLQGAERLLKFALRQALILSLFKPVFGQNFFRSSRHSPKAKLKEGDASISNTAAKTIFLIIGPPNEFRSWHHPLLFEESQARKVRVILEGGTTKGLGRNTAAFSHNAVTEENRF